MKKVTLIALLCALFTIGYAQDQTLFNKSNRFGFFISTISEIGNINGFHNSTGTGFGFVIDDFHLGGYGLVGADFEPLFLDEDLAEIKLAHGGFWLGYSVMQHRVLHPYFAVRAGWGVVDVELDKFGTFDEDFVDNVFVLSPQAGLELNIFRWLRLAATGSYRRVYDVSNDPRAFDGFTANINVKIGWFGRNRLRNW